MKKITLILASLATLSFGISSCDKNEDTPSPLVKPTITLDSTNVASVADSICGHWTEDVWHVNAGDTLKVYFTIKGESALSQYKLAAHENFDCHHHETDDEDINAWTVNKIETIPGDVTTYVAEAIHVIADSATKGQYHYSINAIDNLGNEADELEYNVIIK